MNGVCACYRKCSFIEGINKLKENDPRSDLSNNNNYNNNSNNKYTLEAKYRRDSRWIRYAVVCWVVLRKNTHKINSAEGHLWEMVWKISIVSLRNRIHHLQRIPSEHSCLHSSYVEPFYQQTKYTFTMLSGIETTTSQPVSFPIYTEKTPYHFITFGISFENRIKNSNKQKQ